MQSAAQTRHVPLELVEATAYVNTAWEPIFTPAQDGGVGPMNIRPGQLAQASALSGHPVTQIQTEVGANLDAGAALLAKAHTSGTDLASWQPAAAAVYGPYVAGEINAVLRSGASRTTNSGETIVLAPQVLASALSPATAITPANPATRAAAIATGTGTDYAGATWIPASSSNYSVADRPHDYPIDMIIIHDIEGSYASAIQDFQTAGFAASANYVVSYSGQVAQMVREKDIAWHAGNWDYNTRAIGIEHEGFAYTPGLYTTAEYNASAAVAASICSRWGVVLDRTHVIGHYQVPDPNNPGLFGGVDHHTDPGPYWNWTYYMAQAQADAAALPSPPRMMPDPVAVNGLTSVTVSWQPARTCRPAAAPITGYTVVAQPGNFSVDVPATATSYAFQNLTPETTYTVTVTAHNSYGDDSLQSNPATPGRCAAVAVTTTPASPQKSGSAVELTATSTGCPNPLYQFWVLAPGAANWQLAQAYGTSATLTWNTIGKVGGAYAFSVWAQDAASPGNASNGLGSWDAYDWLQYSLLPSPCTSTAVTSSPPSTAVAGTQVTLTASAAGCPAASYEFWILPPGGSRWQLAQPYSPTPTLSWSTAGKALGLYGFSVWARDASSPGLAGDGLGRWDSYTTTQYSLKASPCASVSASAAPTGSAAAGTGVTISAVAAGCPNPQYQFWLRAPGSTTWRVAQPFSPATTFDWTTSAQPAGAWLVAVWVRDASSPGAMSGSLGSWDALTSFSYGLTSQPCSGLTASASPTPPMPAGTAVTISAATSGCPNPLYELWVLTPGSSTWQMVQAYSSTGAISWPTAGRPAGTYHFSVWVRDANSYGLGGNSLGRWDTYTTVTYVLS